MENLGIDDHQVVFGNGIVFIFNQEIPLTILYVEQFGESMGMADAWPVSLIAGGRGAEQNCIRGSLLLGGKSNGSGTRPARHRIPLEP